MYVMRGAVLSILSASESIGGLCDFSFCNVNSLARSFWGPLCELTD